ncbi:MAG: glycosyltransferase [Butyrivibrio sp.]|nr:glycosyltransferase [Butyrivibrio sp.]
MLRIALIPAYMPDEKLIEVVRGLYGANFEIVVVNDGSPEGFNNIFEVISPYAVILKHDQNKGKGEALKTGLQFILDNYACPYTVVNADADGQHKIADIINVAEVAASNPMSLVLGSRKMEGKVPLRSLMGNAITRLVFRMSTGTSVYDTQTGLRAYTNMLLPRLKSIRGSRYEYEMNMLMEFAKEGIEIREIPIKTVYIGKNESSHFNAATDSAKIYGEIIKFSASSLISFAVDYSLFCLLSFLTGAIVFSNIFARVISGTINFLMNKKMVFASQKDTVKSALKYVLLAGVIIILNTMILRSLTLFGIPPYVAKIVTEMLLFVFSYIMQSLFIFKTERNIRMKKNLWPVCSAVVLIAFTTYISLDTFVLAKSYDSNATEMNTAMFANIEGDSNEAATDPDTGDEPSDAATTDSNTEAESSDTGASDSDMAFAKEGSGRSRHKPRSGKRKASEQESLDTTENTSGIDASQSYTGTDTVTTDNYTITLSEYYQNDTKIYVADVKLSSAQYLKTAFANDTYGKNVTATTSSIAEDNDAILAINGDYYGVQESGYVIRNGIVYRDTPNGSDVLCIYADGTMGIVNDNEYSAEELVEMGVWQAFSFGPALIENGTVAVDESDEVGKAMASNPRTAIGLIDSNHFVFVVSDGRTEESEGLSLYELANFMDSLGVKTAYNLDGGGSSTMYFNGYVVNNPTSSGSIKERSVSDIIYI